MIFGLLNELHPKICVSPGWLLKAISLNRWDLRGRNQCVPPLHTCGKPPTPSNPAQLLAQIIAGHLNMDNGKKQWKLSYFHQINWAYNLLKATFWARMTSIFYARQFFISSEHILDILRAKKSIEFSPNFSPFFTARLTSERYNDPLKVIPEGSMVQYLPVEPKGAPKTIFGKKIFQAWNP